MYLDDDEMVVVGDDAKFFVKTGEKSLKGIEIKWQVRRPRRTIPIS